MRYIITQYRKLVCEIEADSLELAKEISTDLSDSDFTVEDWNEDILEITE